MLEVDWRLQAGDAWVWRAVTEPVRGRVEFNDAREWFSAAESWNARWRELPIALKPWGSGAPLTASVRIDALPKDAAPRSTVVAGVALSPLVLDASRVVPIELELLVAPELAPLAAPELVELTTGRRFALTADGAQGGVRLRTRLEHVVLGQRLDFTVQRNDASDPLKAIVAVDEVRDDRRAEVRLGAGMRSLEVTVTSDGAAVRNRELELAVFESAPWKKNDETRNARVSTDSEGAFIVDVAELPWLERRLVVVQRGGEPEDDRVGALDFIGGEARVELSPRARLQLEVVDHLGEPMEWSKLGWDWNASWYEFHWSYGRIGGQTPAFDEHGRARLVRSTASYAWHRGWRCELILMASGYVPVCARSNEGDSVMRVVLEPFGSVSGYLRANDRSSDESLNLLLLRRQRDEPEALASGVSLGCSCDGRFQFDNLLAGEFTLVVRRIRTGEAPQELARVERIQLGPGQALDLGDVAIE